MKTATKIIAEQVDFETSKAESKARIDKMWKIGAISGWTFAGLFGIGVATLVPYIAHNWLPVPVVHDKETGGYYVDTRGMVADPFDPSFKGTVTQDLTTYVRAHEGFTRGEADEKYKQVWLMSSQGVRGQWDAYIKPSLNAASPVNTFAASDQKAVENMSISFIDGSSEKGVRVAIVRYDLRITQGNSPTTVQRFAATVTFKYDKSNIPDKLDDYSRNPYGFTVLNYHADADGPVRTLQTGQPVPTGVFPTMPSAPSAPASPGPFAQPAQSNGVSSLITPLTPNPANVIQYQPAPATAPNHAPTVGVTK